MTRSGQHHHSDFYSSGRRVRKKLATDLDAAKDILVEPRSRAQQEDYGLLDNDCPLAELKRHWLRHCRQVLKPRPVTR
jgi:hypothetical protein